MSIYDEMIYEYMMKQQNHLCIFPPTDNPVIKNQIKGMHNSTYYTKPDEKPKNLPN